ncbi:carbamoyltransferase C-terminal domain-containing protein [Streptomyces sp. NPDC050619]|uniref:carbamoyltransferase family protein n=1 Tax=Streptomyces sp. NPDC050619 TaxID=3157214 RepID=UPI0034237813
MARYILGLSGGPFRGHETYGMPDIFFHDASAVILAPDGEVLWAAEEERHSRVKKTTLFPANAVAAGMRTLGLSASDIDAVGYYFDERFCDQSLNDIYFWRSDIPRRTTRELLHERLSELSIAVAAADIQFVDHHSAHAAATQHGSGWTEDSLVVVMDGGGGRDSTTAFLQHDGSLHRVGRLPLEKSFGMMYAYATHALGYRWGDEYKVMGLAPYGDPARFTQLLERVAPADPVNGVRLNAEAFRHGLLESGWKLRAAEDPFDQIHKDFAAAVQLWLETNALRLIRHWRDETRTTRLAFSGGVAHNSTLNGRILNSGLFDAVYVHPASHDAGAALGAALIRRGDFRSPSPRPFSPYLGTAYDVADIERAAEAFRPLITVRPATDAVREAAALLADEKIIGWFQGRSEFGPRALGNRSILADPRPAVNRDRVNFAIKSREGFRPFAPATTPEGGDKYFDLGGADTSFAYMSHVVPVRPEFRTSLGATTHVDGTARLQIVDAQQNPRFHALIDAFAELSGVPVVLNTSMNNSHEPMVETPVDAIRLLLTSSLDALILEDLVVSRSATTDLADFTIELPVHVRLEWRLPERQWFLLDTAARTYHRQRRISPATAAVISERSAITASVTDETRELWRLRWIDVVKIGAATLGTTSAR